ncbi:quinol monooxygenase YgiN [Jatrophihabitans sp. GAS493]|uniref:putative quinol monooxygenase n=1 Tax=Jatrophihabitans sp. GAS493 TaxID=1907575 RepID=UPI000BBF4AD4|nr:antibiotic biosynthesis monooxygenase family protein [Jatrophihabitans sp. GAS493]SOD70780.1 quinol monooxygenase YgiN [Jatrophihabitans sp. GAS493]
MLHGRLAAKSGMRGDLLAILTEAASGSLLPGCRLYVVGIEEGDSDGVWATEIWESPEAHAASLQMDRVRDQIARAMPLIDVDASTQQKLDAIAGIPA